MKLKNILFSKATMAILLLLFAIACSWATFIENDFGSDTAKEIIYNAFWFKLLLVLFSVNILGLIIKHKLYKPGKLPVFLFHLSFIIILLGGGITNFFGYKGIMSIREGASVNTFLSEETYIQVKTTNKKTASRNFKVHFADNTKNQFNKKIETGSSSIQIKLVDFNIHQQKDTQFEVLDLELSTSDNKKQVKIAGTSGMYPKFTRVMIGDESIEIAYGSCLRELPFSISLDDFVMERYPGSNSPMGYKSRVRVEDKQNQQIFPYEIYMNHVLNYRGYRIFQSSFDNDEKGTILSVNKDAWGTRVTYLGYLLMSLAMLASLFARKSYFISLIKAKPVVISLVLLFLLPLKSNAAESIAIPKYHADRFSKLLIQDSKGRIKPMYTHASEVLRKVSRKTEIDGLDPAEWLLSLYANPAYWYNKPFIKINHKGIQELFGIETKYISMADLFPNGNVSDYQLIFLVKEAYKKKPGFRSKFDTEIIRVDERVNVLLMTMNDVNMNIFPSEIDSLGRWFNPHNVDSNFVGVDSVFARQGLGLYKDELQKSITTNNWEKPDQILESFFKFQQNKTNYDLPGKRKISMEILYYKANIFHRIAFYYFFVGFILLILQFIHIFQPKLSLKVPEIIGIILVLLLFLSHTFGLGLRWIISNHGRSNGYEALIFISWIIVLTGLIFSRRSGIILSIASILAFLTLNTAHLSFMDPQITNLVPVLNSFWLILHVDIITASYGFLGIGALLAAFILLIMFFENKQNKKRVDGFIDELTHINQVILIIGLYLLTIGTFLGGIWANETWGRYWGWDPKETWALITILVYAFILHMRLIPWLQGPYAFNLMALLGFDSVMMTYFGVNYYLSGLHSYAAGEPMPFPSFIYYIIGTITVIAVLAYINQKKIKG